MKKQIKITIIGDILFQKELSFKKNTNCLSDVTGFLSESDYVIGNLETPISDDKKDIKEELYCFTAPKHFAEIIKKSGIDFVSTANNHCLDNGIEGIDKTIDCLDDLNIDHDGTYKDSKKLFVKTVGDKKIGILSYTYGTNAFVNNVYMTKSEYKKINITQRQELSNAIYRFFYQSKNIFIKALRKVLTRLNIGQFNTPLFMRKEKSMFRDLIDDIEKIAKESDYIIALLHDGGQGNAEPTKRVIDEAFELEKVIKNGAIIINHEHMIHPVVVKDRKVITYSLGNFLGVNGVKIEPFNKMQEYSLGVNIYIRDDSIKYSCVFFINIKDANGMVKTKLLYDLINSTEDSGYKKQLINDLEILKKKVLISEKGVKKEYYVR